MSKKLTTDDFISRSNNKHGIGTYDYSLSEYNGHTVKVKIICKKHGTFEQRPYSHWSGAGCDICDDERASLQYRKTTEEYKKEVSEKHKDEVLVVGEYFNNKTKILHKCKKCNNEWEALPSNVTKKGSGCPSCGHKQSNDKRRLSLQDCHYLAKKRGFNCLSTEYVSARKKLKWECQYGHTWYAPFYSIKSGRGCLVCYNESTKRGSSQRLPQEYVVKEAKKLGLTLLDEYTNCGEKLKWKCDKDHIWISTWDRISRNGNCCFDCYIERNKELTDERSGLCLIGKNESKYFTLYVNELFNDYVIIPQFMVEKKKGWPYFVDFVIPELNLAIEYDEKGHDFQKEKDARRQKYIERQTGLNFIRVKDKDFMKTNKSTLLENVITGS